MAFQTKSGPKAAICMVPNNRSSAASVAECHCRQCTHEAARVAMVKPFDIHSTLIVLRTTTNPLFANSQCRPLTFSREHWSPTTVKTSFRSLINTASANVRPGKQN